MKLDILAFGVHPDDVELGCGGTLLSAINEGKKVGVIDLTRGEMGTRGDPETRLNESKAAAQILNLSVRANLNLEDCFFANNKTNQLLIVQAIRKYQPEIVLCNAPEDRHPDHGRSCDLVSDAFFLSGLRKIETFDNRISQQQWKPKYLFSYIQDRYLEPSFLIDISKFIDKKISALECYSTQFFNPTLNEPTTYISTPEFMGSVKGRAMLFGKRIGVQYAEGFISKKTLGLTSFDSLIQFAT